MGCIEEENRYESEIQAALLDEFILHLAKLDLKCKYFNSHYYNAVSFKQSANMLSPWCEYISYVDHHYPLQILQCLPYTLD